MSQGISKILSILLYALLGLSAIIGVASMLDVVSVNVFMYWAYILLAITTACAIIFPVITMGKNPAGAKSALIGLVGLLVVFVIGYVLAGDEVAPYGKFLDDPAVSKRVGTGLIAFYVLALGAIGAIIFSEVSRAFK